MPYDPDHLLRFLAENGIPASTVSHAPVFTVAEMLDSLRDMPGQHTKNLFLRDAKKKAFLVTLPEDRATDLKQLGLLIGAKGRLSFGSPERLWEALGVRPGSVSPLAAINDEAGDVTVVLDRALMQAEAVLSHPLSNDRTTSLTPDDLMRFLRLVGHEPVLVDLEGEASAS